MGQGIATTSKGLVFVLSPFGAPFDSYYDKIIKPAIEEGGHKALRADEIYGHRYIITDIWQSIQEAKIVVAEMTSKNANVLYEVGLCHAIGKPVVIVTQTIDDVPFDLRPLRCIVYPTNKPGWDIELKKNISQALAAVAVQDDHWILARPNQSSGGGRTRSLPLTKAIESCTLGKHEINEMRIFAFNSGTIQPIVEGSAFKTETCYLLLPRFLNSLPATREDRMNTGVQRVVGEWKVRQAEGRIKDLRIRYYDHFPSHYCCVFGDFAAILGTYIYRDWDSYPWNHRFSDALVITDDERAQALIIKWFDDVFNNSKP
jgi:hypothetical protein